MLTKSKSVRRLLPRSGYDVIAVIAMFAALGTGGAYAVGLITGAEIVDDTVASIDIKNASLAGADVAPNTLTGTHIIGGSVDSSDITDASITGADVTPSTLTGTHVVESSLGKVPSAATADVAGDVYVKSLDYHNVAADDTMRTYMALNLPAGKYTLTAKVPAANWDKDWSLYCRLRLGGTLLDSVIGSANKAHYTNLTLIAAGSLSAAGTANLECAQSFFPDYDGHIYGAKLMAVKVANVTHQP